MKALDSHRRITELISQMWHPINGGSRIPPIEITGEGDLPSVFATTDLATASIGAAGLAVAELASYRHGLYPLVRVDRRLSSMWFDSSLRPHGWALPPLWDAISGDYRAGDGWIRLHTHAPRHREVALEILGVRADKAQVTRAVSRWIATDLETAIVENGGCSAVMRTAEAWAHHPQGKAVINEPLLSRIQTDLAPAHMWAIPKERPLRGVRVLDLTRVLAGPVATRFLAGFGADVLRIDPPWHEDAAVVPEVTLGKRCAHLDLNRNEDRKVFDHLLGRADVLLHGYRPDALAQLGWDSQRRRQICPGLIDVSLDAYGWTGPWRLRRGFDSLVQMSTGIADAGMRQAGNDRPSPLPVQALDHATGYLLASAAIQGVTLRLHTGIGSEVRTSLARMAGLLVNHPVAPERLKLAPESAHDQSEVTEQTFWGAAHRIKPPLDVEGATMYWDLPATPLGTSPASW